MLKIAKFNSLSFSWKNRESLVFLCSKAIVIFMVHILTNTKTKLFSNTQEDKE
jgi:hypothetical protein